MSVLGKNKQTPDAHYDDQDDDDTNHLKICIFWGWKPPNYRCIGSQHQLHIESWASTVAVELSVHSIISLTECETLGCSRNWFKKDTREVGYKTGLEDCTSSVMRISFPTDSMLLKEAQGDPIFSVHHFGQGSWGNSLYRPQVWWSSYEDMMMMTRCQDHIFIDNIWFTWS